jgi:general stress protein YciG
MDEDQISQILSEIGRRGGKARAKALTPERRKEIATKASKAAAKARRKRTKARNRQHGGL